MSAALSSASRFMAAAPHGGLRHHRGAAKGIVPIFIDRGAPLSLQQKPRSCVRLQAGFSQPRPRGFGSQPKISKTTPCKVAGGRRQGRFGPILDTSGKSTALFHHRTIHETPVGLQWRAVRCDLGENPYPRLNLQWLVKLQRLAEAIDRLRAVR
jgi:hypothetical protein